MLEATADRPPMKPRSRAERARYSGRSREGVSVRRLAAELRTALGTTRLDAITSAAIQRAAELGVIASELRAKRLRGDASVDVTELVRAEGAYRRAIIDLGVKPGMKREPAGPTLAEYLASRGHAADDGEADER